MKISITGVDGTGKSTLVRELQRDFRAFRAPQYHENADAPFGSLSRAIDDLGTAADLRGDLPLKACALFLSMTLYGTVEAFHEHAYAPAVLFSERQALADSLAYAQFYKALLKGPLAEGASPEIEAWSSRVGVEFRDLPIFIRQLFDLRPRDLVARLMKIYRCSYPDQIVLLKVRPDRLMERLAAKGAAPEAHEKRDILVALQGALEQSCRFLTDLNPATQLHILDTSDLDVEQTRLAVLAVTGVEVAAE